MEEKIAITEKMKVHEEWYKEAENQTLETLPDFLKKLSENYEHDYGTTCHALGAAAVAAAYAMNESPASYGGITGFQAGAVMWSFIRNWNYKSNKCGLKIFNYDNMLYPQYEDDFEKTIDKDVWKLIQEEALSLLRNSSDFASNNVVNHWKSIIDGNIPFGYKIEE